MPLTDAQSERLQAYSEKKDRGREPAFVGREDLFSLVAGNARAILRGDVEGRTVCIAGPPGIGKTAFLSTLAMRSAVKWSGPPMVCVMVNPADLHSPARVLEEVASQTKQKLGRPLQDRKGFLERLSSAAVSIGGGGFHLSGSTSWREKSSSSQAMPWAGLRAAVQGMPDGTVICLLVDEGHGLGDTPGFDYNVLLRSLHMGPPSGSGAPPVFAVLAGHTHTPDVVEKSISWRFADGNQQYMRGLSDAESLDYVERTLDHLGVSKAEPGRGALAHWIVGECGGFPHHLRNAMQSVAEGLLRSDGLALSGLDGSLVPERLRVRRVRYYDRRTTGAMAQAGPQLGALLREWSRRAKPVNEAEGQRDMSALLDGLPEQARREIEDEGIVKGRDLMVEMVRKGALMTDLKGGGCRCPIDSLIGWLETGMHEPRSPFPMLSAGPASQERSAPPHAEGFPGGSA